MELRHHHGIFRVDSRRGRISIFLPLKIKMVSIHTMSLTLRCPPANTIAFGGVATGNMKANEQEIVAGIIRYHG